VNLRRFLGKTAVAGVLAAAATVAADERHVRASLVCDAGALDGGESFTLGVLFEPEPGWHIYWRNPGEAGLATEVVYGLPEGFLAGEVRWPTPVFFEQPGGLAGYGYEQPVVLAAEIRPPAGAPTRANVTLEASWLACKDVCVFESAELTARLPLAGDELARSEAAVEGWRDSLPKTPKTPPFTVNVTGGPVPETGPADLVIWLSWPEPPKAVELFPDPGVGLKVENLRVRTRATTTRVDVTVSRLNNPSGRTSSLRSLVVATADTGVRSATVTHIELERKTQ
jgi:DsbC/DsbD-like thiol-disulfide interchange protein